MTTSATPTPGGPGGAPAGTDGEVLVRAAGVELLGELPGSGYRRPPALARRGDGQVLQLTPLLHLLLAEVDGRRTVQELAAAVGAASGRLVRPEDVRTLVDRSLRPLGLLRTPDGREPEVRRSDPLLALHWRRVVTDPVVTRRLTAPFAALFTPLLVVPVVLAFVAISGWVLFREGLAAATAQAFDRPALFLTVVLLTVLSAGFHEFGHAAAARYGGATPGAMGFGFYLFWPAFYTDVTDSYRLGRAGRVRTDLGGLYFNALVVLAVTAVWWGTGWDALLLVVVTQVLQVIRQLAPLLRFDGYHVLADVTGVPDLYQRMGPVLTGVLPRRWRRPEADALKPWARAVVIAWILVVVPLMAVSLLLLVLALPRVLATAWAAVRQEADGLGTRFSDGDVLGVLASCLAVVALAVPVLGIGYVLARLVRRIATGVWRRTAGRPGRRALAGVVAAALVAGLGWAWWPDGDRYRPVRADEGGTVLDAVPAAWGGPAGTTELAPAASVVLWPEDAGPLPTADAPVAALVLVPAGTGAADDGTGGDAGRTPADAGEGATGGVEPPTWVFPFDRPLPPGEGDNQALAVVTEDGAVRYDVSFALVWADGDEVVNRNEAHAYASCRGCTAVAVAFQVVLVVGSVDVVVPENLATAANYACLDCVTHALATQLVVSVPGVLDAEGTAALAALWEELHAFAATIEGVPLSEIRDRLTEYEQRVLDIVRGPTGSPPASGDTGSPDGTADPTPAGDGAGATATPTDGADPSAGPAGGTGTPTGDGTADDGTGDPAPTGAEPTGQATPSAPEADPTGSTSSPPGTGGATDAPATTSPTG
ncbi:MULTISPECIES: hypothetical protein [unclassified Blastococcus]